MAFFRSVSVADTFSAIHGEGVFLRVPETSDYAQWSALREASRDFLTPWEPTWPADDLSRGAFRRRLRRYADDMRADLAYPFFLFERNQNHLLGGLTLTNVRRGVAQAASLGYWIGLPYARRGFMSAGVRALLPFAFQALRLHRVEAACIPSNAASMRLLEKCGFKPEGRAREYLCINGIWQDHLLYACLSGDRS
ncbi:MAG: GNAT family N-acetyltransferase [Pseudorhodoplanes sp.]